jgi:hypothetical protein
VRVWTVVADVLAVVAARVAAGVVVAGAVAVAVSSDDAVVALAAVVLATGPVAAVSATVATWLCPACLPMRALSATKAATATAVTRRFQVRLRASRRGFVIARSFLRR